ncbi:hypothetical protein CBER1_05318 [Cercospora berteroae]|uniref:Uncharacterized protein n=1 Tax=Cercospora berteroae TaxID=357750 RepID=A0A2S6CEC1_9PEZI|nr:hypothetical protein CBER1_05318 [Cercospora berteroae]
MKLSLLLISALTYINSTAAKITYHLEFSDNKVNVGTLHVYDAIINAINAKSDARGGILDQTRRVFQGGCQHRTVGDNTNVNIIMEGAWGTAPGTDGWQMRQAITGSLWEGLKHLETYDRYNTHLNCCGYTWSNFRSVAR